MFKDEKIKIIKDISKGSNANTYLCKKDNLFFYRKICLNNDKDKLYKQILWLNEHNNIKCTKILNYEYNDDICYYDMEYVKGCCNLFQYSSKNSFLKCKKLFDNILFDITNNILNGKYVSNYEIIFKYIQEKLINNLYKICNDSRIKKLIKYDKLIINGVEYNNLNYFSKYLNVEYLNNVFKDDIISNIHGDLTLENIICDNNSYYIIDPNPENILNSNNLEFGKLMQSLHGNYESLDSAVIIEFKNNCINYKLDIPNNIKKLYNYFDKYLVNNGYDIKSIYFHEIIHWFRLLPYKLSKNDKNYIIFYSMLIIIMNDIVKRFDNNEKIGNI